MRPAIWRHTRGSTRHGTDSARSADVGAVTSVHTSSIVSPIMFCATIREARALISGSTGPEASVAPNHETTPSTRADIHSRMLA